ncbi:hypothetical protein CH063_02441 [Colletotrichum higginsianum]|uniref:Uncharacterized protein n=1 Tax=Colletotrichum higginsianum (strain IMI 349063) TaxID=759273 RepID=H1VKT2_COLHI|nr:hypothetical protein CH063_02441 [Colletotrichum higginsianum]
MMDYMINLSAFSNTEDYGLFRTTRERCRRKKCGDVRHIKDESREHLCLCKCWPGDSESEGSS